MPQCGSLPFQNILRPTPSTVNLSRNCVFRCELRESGIRRLTSTFISTRFSQTTATGLGRFTEFTGNLIVFSACWARHSSQCREGLHASWHLMGLSVSPRYRSQSAHGICCERFFNQLCQLVMQNPWGTWWVSVCFNWILKQQNLDGLSAGFLWGCYQFQYVSRVQTTLGG